MLLIFSSMQKCSATDAYFVLVKKIPQFYPPPQPLYLLGFPPLIHIVHNFINILLFLTCGYFYLHNIYPHHPIATAKPLFFQGFSTFLQFTDTLFSKTYPHYPHCPHYSCPLPLLFSTNTKNVILCTLELQYDFGTYLTIEHRFTRGNFL